MPNNTNPFKPLAKPINPPTPIKVNPMYYGPGVVSTQHGIGQSAKRSIYDFG